MNRTVVYGVPASLLYKAARALQPAETLCFVSGIKLGQMLGQEVIVLTELVPVESSSSRVHVSPHPSSVLREQQRLRALGQDLEAQFHSHPGTTIEATRPSCIDLDTARRWENGAPFICAIFSEGGRFVRFYSRTQYSEVKIYGLHIPTAEPSCYELPSPPEDLLPARATPPHTADD